MSTHLFVPKKQKANPPRPIISPAEYDRQQRERRAAAKRAEFAGRNVGKPEGTFVTDEAEQQKGILLCWKCDHKFNPSAYHYYKTKEFRVQGRCDGCREHTPNVNFYIYEGLLGRKSGQCWMPR